MASKADAFGESQHLSAEAQAGQRPRKCRKRRDSSQIQIGDRFSGNQQFHSPPPPTPLGFSGGTSSCKAKLTWGDRFRAGTRSPPRRPRSSSGSRCRSSASSRQRHARASAGSAPIRARARRSSMSRHGPRTRSSSSARPGGWFCFLVHVGFFGWGKFLVFSVNVGFRLGMAWESGWEEIRGSGDGKFRQATHLASQLLEARGFRTSKMSPTNRCPSGTRVLGIGVREGCVVLFSAGWS